MLFKTSFKISIPVRAFLPQPHVQIGCMSHFTILSSLHSEAGITMVAYQHIWNFICIVIKPLFFTLTGACLCKLIYQKENIQ